MRCAFADECKGCVDTINPFLEGVGEVGRAMIIGDSPSYFEATKRTLFGTAIGKQLYMELKSKGVDMEELYLTKAMKCYQPEYSRAMIKHCREVLLEEIRRVKPTVILALGGLTLDVLIGKSNISKHRGTIIYVEGVPVVPTYNPGAALHRPELATEYNADLDYFAKLAKADGMIEPVLDDFTYTIVRTRKELVELYDKLKDGKTWYAYDIETNICESEHDSHSTIFMIGIGLETGECFIIPWEAHKAVDNYVDLGITIDQETVEKFLNAVFTVNKHSCGQYVKYDNRWLRSRGVTPYIAFDTYLAAYVINSSTPHGLKHLARVYCGAVNYEEGIQFKDRLTTQEFVNMAKYCALDVYYTMKLKPILEMEMAKDARPDI